MCTWKVVVLCFVAYGLHLRLDLTQPEQQDVAREVVKVGRTVGLDAE
jgi:hypothetical protein